MNKLNLILVGVVVACFASSTAQAKCGKNQSCGPAAPIVCENLSIEPQLWTQLKAKYNAEGKNAYWQPRTLVCGGGCITFGKKRSATAWTCAPRGTKLCYVDTMTGEKHVWTMDGIDEPVR